jgi:hypothetical protein
MNKKITCDWTLKAQSNTKGLTLNVNPMNIDLTNEPLLKETEISKADATMYFLANNQTKHLSKELEIKFEQSLKEHGGE